MRFPQRGHGAGLKFNLTPMIDVVFNLIIFFLAASHLARSEIAADVELPAASTGGPEQSELTKRLTITVLPGGEFDVGGASCAMPRIEQMIAAGQGARKESRREFEVRIRTDRHVPYARIEPLLIACARSGVTKVRFAVLPVRPGDP
jgi:biopolymer transport protein ExbD